MTLTCGRFSGTNCLMCFGAAAYPDAIIKQLLVHIQKKHKQTLTPAVIKAKLDKAELTMALQETDRLEALKLNK